MGKQSKVKRERRRQRDVAEARNPLGAVTRYADALTVFGKEITPSDVIDRMRTFNWSYSLLRLAHLAAVVAHDPMGPKSAKVQRWARNALGTLNGSNASVIAHAKAWAKSGDEAVVVHEEALDYAQHLVLLYGSDDDESPGDSELVLWLLGAAQLIGGWEVEDGSDVSETEALIAEQVRVARFNNSEDSLNLLVRTADMFGKPPFAGKLANSETWSAIQMAAFGCQFAEHFETRILPLYNQSLLWGKQEDELPILDLETWAMNVSAATGKQIVDWLSAQSRTRDELASFIRAPMKGAAIPRAPTTLLHHPMVRVSDNRIAIASPWRILTHLRTGIWFAFMQGTKAVLGKSAAQDWTAAFGYMFEEWLRTVARYAATPAFKGRLILSEHPGRNEIDDVVVLEGNTAVLFSAKARLVEEPVARDAKSKRMVMDWYMKFLFAQEQGAFRAGAVRQFDAVIERIRSGAFPEMPRDCRIVPVLVTYDTLCEEYLLYEWIGQQCQAFGLLQQPGVAPLAIAHVNDYERLLGRASRGLSLATFFRARDGDWKGRRLQNQIGVTAPEDRLPQMEGRFVELMNSLTMRLFGKPMSPEKIRSVTTKRR